MTGWLAAMLFVGFCIGYCACWWATLMDDYDPGNDTEYRHNQPRNWTDPEPRRPYDFEVDDPYGTGRAS